MKYRRINHCHEFRPPTLWESLAAFSLILIGLACMSGIVLAAMYAFCYALGGLVRWAL